VTQVSPSPLATGLRAAGTSSPSTALRRSPRSLSALVAAVLCACASPEARGPLPLRSVPPFAASGEAPLSERWWSAFGDEELDGRVELALSDNFSLAVAWERMREATAVARAARSDLYPQLDGVGFADRREASDGEDTTQVGLGLEASWEIDLWGRIRSLAAASRLRAAATAEDYRTAAISLSAEVALTWYSLSEARLQAELIASQLETNRTVTRVLENRFAVGQSGAADVLRQRQLVEATREQSIVALSRVEVLEHLLAVLEGRPPQGEASFATSPLPRVPPSPATGLPADLLERRPDVRGALLRLEAADADVAAAVRDRYPRIDLAASLTTLAERPADLFEDWLATLAGSVVGPITDGGARRAEVERSVAARRRLLADYGQTVLGAFQEVEDALAQEAYQVRRITSLETQLGLARSTYAQLRLQYLNGAADYIDILTALREQQRLERSLLSARLDRIVLRIALHRALAGSFRTPNDGPPKDADPEDADPGDADPGDTARGDEGDGEGERGGRDGPE